MPEPQDTALNIRGLEMRFSGFHLGPLDVTVPRGALYGLIGPNGAGKTTTIDLIMGMGREDAGRISVLGFDHRLDEVAVKSRVGYVSPDLSYDPWGRVDKAINFIRAFYPDWDDDYCERLLRAMNIGWRDPIKTLSFGARIKLSLIMALSHRPDVLILDEPTVGLDAASRRQLFSELLAAVENSDRTVFISSHSLSDVERFCDHIGILHKGQMLAEGSTADLIERYRQVDFVLPEGRTLDGASGHSLLGAGIIVQEQDGNRIRVVVDVQSDAMQRLRESGAQEIASAAMNLEDVFLALTGGMPEREESMAGVSEAE